jgi:hypothetical protein
MSKEEMGQPCSPPGNRPKAISNRCAGKFSVARLGDRNQEWEIHLKPSDISGAADAPTIRGGPRKGPATTGAAWLTKKTNGQLGARSFGSLLVNCLICCVQIGSQKPTGRGGN